MGWPNNYAEYTYDSNGNVIGVSGVTGTTWALKPAAASYIGTAFITDIGRGTFWTSNGVRWTPLNGRCVLYTKMHSVQSAVITSATNIIAEEMLLKAGVWQTGDILNVTASFEKLNGITDTIQAILMLSSVQGTVGTVTEASFPLMIGAGTTRSSGAHRLRKYSSTVFEAFNSKTADTGLSFAAGGRVSATMPNLDNAVYLQLGLSRTAGAGGTEQVVTAEFTVELISNTQT